MSFNGIAKLKSRGSTMAIGESFEIIDMMDNVHTLANVKIKEFVKENDIHLLDKDGKLIKILGRAAWLTPPPPSPEKPRKISIDLRRSYETV
jgi:hypothetical protein